MLNLVQHLSDPDPEYSGRDDEFTLYFNPFTGNSPSLVDFIFL